MTKRLLKIFGIILGVLLILILAITLSIDHIVKSGIERIGGDMFETELSVDNVSISVFSGNGTIDGIRVANPEDFNSGTALTVRSVHIQMQPLTLFSDTIVINEIDVQALDVSYELIAARSNLGQLRRNLQAYTAAREPLEAVVDIDRFIMDESTLTIRTDIEGIEPETLILPRIEHTDIGRDEDADMAAIMIVVLDVILNKVTEAGLEQLLEEGERRLRREAENAIRDLIKN